MRSDEPFAPRARRPISTPASYASRTDAEVQRGDIVSLTPPEVLHRRTKSIQSGRQSCKAARFVCRTVVRGAMLAAKFVCTAAPALCDTHDVLEIWRMSKTGNAVEVSERLKQLPPYLFIEIDRLKNEARARGEDVIDLGVGDPDVPTPPEIVEALKHAAEKPENHRYPLGSGLRTFRQTITDYYERRFGVAVNADTEVLALIGSKEGIGHVPLAFVNPGDVVLVPDPCYPVYVSGTVFAGGVVHRMPLAEANGFLPDLDGIDASVWDRARILFLNYPNNPTAAVATLDFFEKVVFYAKKHGVIVCHDAAYVDVSLEERPQPSFLQVKGAKDVGIEFYSLSKTFNMTGWRIGAAVGNRGVIGGLARVKANLDSGVFNAIQEAAVRAFEIVDDVVARNAAVIRARRDAFLEGLKRAGWAVRVPTATFYCWIPVRSGVSSMELTKRLLTECSIVATPGGGLGEHGEGYVRFAMTVAIERIREAVRRIAQGRF
jgi:LL-diaminopimelate aminotransferase